MHPPWMQTPLRPYHLAMLDSDAGWSGYPLPNIDICRSFGLSDHSRGATMFFDCNHNQGCLTVLHTGVTGFKTCYSLNKSNTCIKTCQVIGEHGESHL